MKQKRVENSNEDNKEKIIARLEKLDTIGVLVLTL